MCFGKEGDELLNSIDLIYFVKVIEVGDTAFYPHGSKKVDLKSLNYVKVMKDSSFEGGFGGNFRLMSHIVNIFNGQSLHNVILNITTYNNHQHSLRTSTIYISETNPSVESILLIQTSSILYPVQTAGPGMV